MQQGSVTERTPPEATHLGAKVLSHKIDRITLAQGVYALQNEVGKKSWTRRSGATKDRKQSLTFLAYLFYIAKQMKRGELLGSLEHIILLALARLDGNAHGMIVRREIEERTGRNISIGAVYATLERLEAKGYVSSSTGDPTPERGGRAKRLFRVEAAGNRALQVSDQTIRSMTADLKGRWETI